MINFLFDILFLSNKKNKWWVKINTAAPCCTYYFGPFDSVKEAKSHRTGYIEDLIEEKPFGITVEIKQCKPTCLTIFDEE